MLRDDISLQLCTAKIPCRANMKLKAPGHKMRFHHNVWQNVNLVIRHLGNENACAHLHPLLGAFIWRLLTEINGASYVLLPMQIEGNSFPI